MHTLIDKASSLLKMGLFHVLGSTFINKIVAFITNVFIVRILSKYDYGIFSGAFNVFLVAVLFNGFGISSATLFFASEKENERIRNIVYRFSLKYGLCINTLLSIGILIYGLIGNTGIAETRPYILSLTPMPIIYFFSDYYAIVLRTRKDNKKYALLLNIGSVSYALLAITGSYLFGIGGTICGRYLSYLLTAIIGFIFTRQFFMHDYSSELASKEKRDSIMKYAAYSGGVSALNNILYKIDIALVTLLIADANLLATYKVATVVPENMNFIPSSILVVFLPLFIENEANKEWIVKKSRELFSYMAIVCGFISIVLVLFADLAVRILWGIQYLDAVPVFRILSLSFFFLGTFRSTSTNILQALGKVKFNFYVSIGVSISNIILDYILISQYGIMGAAIATLLVTILGSCASFPYLVNTLRKYKTESSVVQ